MMRSTRQSRRGQAITLCALITTAASVGQLAVATPLRAQMLRVEGLRIEYQQNPIGIDVRVPRLSLRIQA